MALGIARRAQNHAPGVIARLIVLNSRELKVLPAMPGNARARKSAAAQ
jgi:hypothetical protein